MKIAIPAAVTTRVARTVLLGQKHSPTILFGAGIVGVVATTVSACRATLKLEDILEESTTKQLQASHVLADKTKDYSEKDYNKDLAILRTQTVFKIGKLYAPSIILGTLSVAALSGSHIVLSKRNAGLTAAYAAVDKAFSEYRERVVDEYGEEKDRELRHGVETVTVKQKGGDGKTKVKTFKKSSMYAKLFHEGNPNWDPHPEYNIMFLRGIQRQLNDKLWAQGHLFLNEAYDELGLGRTPAGSQVGWIKKSSKGDGFIDFGIFTDEAQARLHDYITGREGEILVDFNVDGIIWDKI